jgi:hypothetical protein
VEGCSRVVWLRRRDISLMDDVEWVGLRLGGRMERMEEVGAWVGRGVWARWRRDWARGMV